MAIIREYTEGNEDEGSYTVVECDNSWDCPEDTDLYYYTLLSSEGDTYRYQKHEKKWTPKPSY